MAPSTGSSPRRPGRVDALRGVIFRSDERSGVGAWFIRPLEKLDRHLAGLPDPPGAPSLAMHAGLHVVMQDGREVVAEQTDGTLFMDFVDGLIWTPIDQFRARDRGGWDVTVPATAFRDVEASDVTQAIARLNAISGRRFFGEDCTAFVERALGRRLFADSPLTRPLGIGVRVGDPALPLLRPDARLDPRAARLLRAEALRDLPDARADITSANGRLWLRRLLAAPAIGGGLAVGATLLARPRSALGAVQRLRFRARP